MRFFVDTNVFLRHMLDDHSEFSPHAREIFDAIEREEMEAWTSDLVVAEIVFVLSGKRTYNLAARSIAEQLSKILALRRLWVPAKRVHTRALALFADGRLDYADAFSAALMETRGEHHILSFDTDFDHLSGITRHDHLPSS